VGASLINTAKAGTSYAAPKVSHAGGVCAAAIEQLRHEAQMVAARGSVRGKTWSSLFPLPELKELKV
jgi:hypothetical protein